MKSHITFPNRFFIYLSFFLAKTKHTTEQQYRDYFDNGTADVFRMRQSLSRFQELNPQNVEHSSLRKEITISTLHSSYFHSILLL